MTLLINIEHNARDGFVIVIIDGNKFKWYWEFGVDEYLAFIKVPTSKEWGNLPLLSRHPRDNVLSDVAEAVCKLKCPGCRYEIGFDSIIIKENFILITKLDKGKLPKGYYVSNGKVCRVHLEEVLQKGLNVGKEEIQNIIQHNNIKAQKRNQIYKNDIAVKIEKYQQLLHSYAGAICSVGVNLLP